VTPSPNRAADKVLALINAGAAQALKLTIAESILLRADEVIR
jgi:hypothetical protein